MCGKPHVSLVICFFNSINGIFDKLMDPVFIIDQCNYLFSVVNSFSELFKKFLFQGHVDKYLRYIIFQEVYS
jgi:hypothetical protein